MAGPRPLAAPDTAATRRRTRSLGALRTLTGVPRIPPLELLEEEPLLIRVDDAPLLVVMRTPGDEVPHAAGFCLGDGIVDSLDDVERFGYDELSDPNSVDVWLREERGRSVRELLRRGRLVSQSSCGICGKRLIEDLHQRLSPTPQGGRIDLAPLLRCVDILAERQEYYRRTRCSHAALLADAAGEPVSFGEDVGRHNALDKAIGHALLDGRLPDASVLVLSSRNSYELIQKAARAQLRIVVSSSRPTALAVELGSGLGMTLAFMDRSELVVVCGEDRIWR
jgi:FdhD protein